MTNEKDKSAIEEIDCLEAIGHLYAYLDGELGAETISKFEHHLHHCRSCFSRAQLEKALSNRLSSMNDDQPPESVENRVRNLLDKL
ncbi:MAG: zf-HC2 domain-containing protein [Gammaproteobacteria bacterium]|jgi:anti-sigma factor (TIGR02949 family)